MFPHILLPLDFSDENRAALDLACRLVDRPGRLTLLHVIERITRDVPDEEVRAFYSLLERRAREELAAVEADLPDDIDASSHLAYGKRARTVVKVAEDERVDLIVMSSQEVGRDDTLRGFTVSHEVALISPIPVLLVR